MLQISGSFPAAVAAEIVERRLDAFNASLEKHVVSCVTDGAAVMSNLGSLFHVNINSVMHMQYIWQYVMYCMERMRQ